MSLHLLGCQASKAEERLLKFLFDKYDLNARPVLHDNESVTVKLGMTVSQIIDVVSTLSSYFKSKCMSSLDDSVCHILNNQTSTS